MYKNLALILLLATSTVLANDKQKVNGGEVDSTAMTHSALPLSIAVNPQRVTFADGGWVEFEVFGDTGPFVFLGPHVYLTPPIPGTMAVTQSFIDALSDRYRVIVADWPRGNGKSDPSPRGEMSADQAAAEILAIADAAGAKTFAYWGYSGGGAIGLQLAARTGRLSALVVGGYPPMWQPVSDMLFAVDRTIRQMTAAGESMDTFRALQEQSRSFYSSISMDDQNDTLKRIGCPKLVYHDIHDVAEISGFNHDLANRTRQSEEELKALGWEVHWMDTGLGHMGMADVGANLAAFVPFLDAALLDN